MRTFREKRTRDLRAPDVIGELFMLLMIVVIGVGAGTGSALVVGLGTTAFVISAGGTLWSKLSLAEVAYGAQPSDSHAFVGDEIEIVMTLENRKPLPIPWVQIIEFLPTGMTPLSDENIKRRAYAGGSEIVETTSLAGYERIRFRHHVRAHHRGHYSIGPTELRSGDLFGLFGTVRRDSRSEHGITVYPRIVPLEGWELPAAKPMGDMLARNMLLDDPSRPRSARDYRPGDPLKRIDWKLSAKRDELTVRTYDQSVSNDVVVMLESRTVDYAWHGYKYDVLESAITGAASIAVRCSDLGYRVALVANGVRPTRGVMSVVPAGDGPASHQDDIGGAVVRAAVVVHGVGFFGDGSWGAGDIEWFVDHHGGGIFDRASGVVSASRITRRSSGFDRVGRTRGTTAGLGDTGCRCAGDVQDR